MKLFACAFVSLLIFVGLSRSVPCDSSAPPKLNITPTFVELPAMELAGYATFATPATGKFPDLWMSFDGVMGNTTGLETGKYAYGLELYPASFMKDKKFTYMVCLKVTDPAKVPLPLLTRTLPASKYAVFAVPNGPENCGATFQFIYGTWLPNSGYVTACPFDFERYDISPGAKGKSNWVEILVPVKPAK